MRPPCCKERAATYAERRVMKAPAGQEVAGEAFGVGSESRNSREDTRRRVRAKEWPERRSASGTGSKVAGKVLGVGSRSEVAGKALGVGSGPKVVGKTLGVGCGPEDGRTAAGRRLSRAAVGAASHKRPPDPGGRRGSHGCPAVRPLRRWPRDRPQRGSQRDRDRNARAESRRCAVRV